MKTLICCIALWGISPLVSAASSSYQIDLLPGVPGSAQSSADAISSAGVVGYSSFFDGSEYTSSPVIWQNSQPAFLPVPSGYQGIALGINVSGNVIGAIHAPASDNPTPALWQNGQLQTLDCMGLPAGVANSINDNGDIVGQIYDSTNGISHAVIWSGSQATSIGKYSTALSINNNGQILVEGSDGLFVWQNGTATQVPSLGGFLNPQAMNNLGHVTGLAAVPGGTADSYGFVFKDGITTALATLPNDTSYVPRAINNSDQIVGYGYNDAEGIHALIWQNGQVFDLNDLIPADSGWILDEATAIDDDGTILGYGQFNGQINAFELTPDASSSQSIPTPEPASLSLLLLGGTILLHRRTVRR